MSPTFRARHALPIAIAAAMLSILPQPSQAQPETSKMHEEDRPARTAVDGGQARLEVAFDPVGERFAVRYRVTNTGDGPLAVFDRGDRHAVLTGRLESGAIAMPRFTQEGGDLSLDHAARALPDPAPTVPPVPLAARLGKGEALDGAFEFDLSLTVGVERVRWCLGVAAFNDKDYRADDRSVDRSKLASGGDADAWQASFAVVDAQEMLCTPWYVLADGGFAVD
ncbi:hypothetical protein [Luteimonas sp. MC1828]|uniref:hypothetical protein n=1 Tax=Luteimonas sp. MC1828 TaxID=2799787 RepID=UPI0018F1E2A9|nr:hypothetical protein [Luteimonas sp. MC1828]MBJ7575929.1 hypothetical protein [Luteimonas sp. MC1828]